MNVYEHTIETYNRERIHNIPEPIDISRFDKKPEHREDLDEQETEDIDSAPHIIVLHKYINSASLMNHTLAH